MYKFLKFKILLFLALECVCLSPSIEPLEQFEPQDDAVILCKAVSEETEGMNFDSVILILTSRTYTQRSEIMKVFHKKCLGKEFWPLFSHHMPEGLFNNIIQDLLTPLDEFYAKEIFRETKTDLISSNAILDILTTSSDKEISDIKNAHKRLQPNSEPLEKLVENPYRTDKLDIDFPVQFLSFPRTSYKNEHNKDFNVAEVAEWFHTIGEFKNALNRPWDDERETVKIFRRSTIDELQAIIKKYKEMYNEDLELAFKNRGFSDDVERGVLTMIRVIKSVTQYFADRLYDSLRGSTGSDTQALTRIIVGRSEIDLADISKEFEMKYGRSLVSIIAGKDEEIAYLTTLESIINGGRQLSTE